MLGPLHHLAPADDLPWHPAANLFPLLASDAAMEMESDVRRRGILEPVVLLDCTLLDGRNRFRAGQRIGMQVPAVEYLGDDPAGFVLSRNLRRRHLTASQRAAVGARLASLPPHRPRKSANLPAYGFSQAMAAASLSVSERSIRLARTVQVDGVADLIEAVDQGRLSVAAAALLATLSHQEQQVLVRGGTAALREAVAAIRDGRKPARTLSTGHDGWHTPPEILDRVRKVFGRIDVDPCSNPEAQRTVRARTYYTVDQDGLSRPWRGRCFLNPPYQVPEIQQFTAKLLEEMEAGRVTQAIVLTLDATDTGWWHRLAHKADLICVPRGRVSCIRPGGTTGSPLQGSSLFYLGANVAGFRAAFDDVGLMVRVA